jgi:steroid 5-alpha reductase family enzyme
MLYISEYIEGVCNIGLFRKSRYPNSFSKSLVYLSGAIATECFSSKSRPSMQTIRKQRTVFFGSLNFNNTVKLTDIHLSTIK